ncbi:hypothetical protein ACPPVO_49615 [Dactylosporangium sp. McL0621]|uniref:hypothetical protein n=1 Tax=Dactylosporangium sp. McL0621 TaxID=3415678 RepID=UPI003CF128DF
MTQQEQHHTYVPGQRDGEPEEHAVGTAHAPYEETDERGGEEAYPASTYASGSADTDVADRDDVEVVDRDEALAEEEREGDADYDNAARGDDDNADREDDTRAVDQDAVDRDEVDAVYGNAVRENEVRETDDEDVDDVDAAYDNAVRENEVRDTEADAEADEAPAAVEDERDEDAIASAEAQEDRQWAAEHATELRAGSTNLDDDETDDENNLDDEPAAVAAPVAVEETTGEAAGDEDRDRDETPVGSTPGSVDVTAVGAIWADGAADGLRERWRELQLRFIDEPRSVADEADALVGEALDTITNSLQAQRRELANWQNEPGDDTERLRAAVRGYRDYLDRLLGM